MDRATADYMGMLATVINALALQDALEQHGRRDARPDRDRDARRSPSRSSGAARSAIWRKAASSIFAAGTGNPYFTTDTAAALRAMEIEADVILKATKVDGIYDADPMVNPTATRFERISYLEVLEQRPQGHGCHRHLAVHGQQPADRRLQPADARQHQARDCGRADRLDRDGVTRSNRQWT